MPFTALVLRVLIASPGDTVGARQVLRETVEDWNSLHAERDEVMLLPVMWERDATPEMGDRAQAIINRQLVDVADVLVGIFWTRLGTPTSEAESGTAEEIKRFIEAGKPVLIYFSSEPVALGSVDHDEYPRLVRFRDELEEAGLIDAFSSMDEFRRKATAALTRTVRERFAHSLRADEGLRDEEARREDARPPARAELLARIDRQRELRGLSRQGRPQYTNRDRLVIENRRTAVAENLTFAFETPHPEEAELPWVGAPDSPIGRLPPRAAVDYPLARAFGTASQWDIVFRWSEGDAMYESRQTLA